MINDSTDTVEGAREKNVDGRAKFLLFRVNRHARLKDDSRLKIYARLGTFQIISLSAVVMPRMRLHILLVLQCLHS